MYSFLCTVTVFGFVGWMIYKDKVIPPSWKYGRIITQPRKESKDESRPKLQRKKKRRTNTKRGTDGKFKNSMVSNVRKPLRHSVEYRYL